MPPDSGHVSIRSPAHLCTTSIVDLEFHDPVAYLPCSLGKRGMLLFWWSTEILALTMTQLCVEGLRSDMSHAHVHGTRISMATTKHHTGQKHSACVHHRLSACVRLFGNVTCQPLCDTMLLCG